MTGDQENSTAANPPTVMADDPTVSSAPTSCVGANWLASRASRRRSWYPLSSSSARPAGAETAAKSSRCVSSVMRREISCST